MMERTCNLQPETTCDWIESTRFGIVLIKFNQLPSCGIALEHGKWQRLQLLQAFLIDS